nr:hypothetical protein [Tanacetum cinerariifolium]
MSLRRVVPKNYDPKGERFLIASRFPIPPLACAFFIPRAIVKQVDYWFKFFCFLYILFLKIQKNQKESPLPSLPFNSHFLDPHYCLILMTSFDSRLNPLYSIKECSSCGALYTADYCSSNESLVDKIICDPNKAPDFPHLHTLSSNKFHCFHCKDELGDGEVCKRCTCSRCGSGLCKGLCLICKQHSLNTSPSISGNPSQSPLQITHLCNPRVIHMSFVGTMLIMVKMVHFKFRSPMIRNLVIIMTLISRKITRMIHMEMILTLVMLVSLSSRLIMSWNQATLKTKILIHMIHRVFHNNILVVPVVWVLMRLVNPQPPQSPIIHQPPQELSIQEMEDLKQQHLDEMKRLINSKYRKEIKFAELKQNFSVTSSLPIEEPDNSLSMGDEHLDTIPATKSDEFIKSSVENLIPIPSESEGTTDNMCDVPFHDNSQPLDVSKDQFEDFFNSNDEFSLTAEDSSSIDNIDNVEASPPDSELVSSEVMEIVILEETNSFDNSLPKSDTLCFDVEEISSGSTTTRTDISLPEYEASYDDQSFSDEVLSEKIFLKPLFEEEIIPMKIDSHPDNAESNLMEFMRTNDPSLIIASKIDSFFDEFVDELTLVKSIPPGIDETDCHPEEETYFTKRLLYDNASPHPLKEFVSTNSVAEIESFSPSPILVKDSDSFMEEIDLSFTLDYPMSSGIEDDDYDSERDILILKDLPSNDTLSIPEKESFHFDIPLFSRPPAKPPDGVTGILNIKMMGDISDQKVPMHKFMITLVSTQEKSPELLSHRGLKTF